MRMTRVLSRLIVLGGLLMSLPVAALEPEVEEAYKKGLADWERMDIPAAMAPLKRAADGGHAAAQALYGYLLDATDEDAEAAKYYQMAADQGNVEGMFNLAALYAGGDGVKKDVTVARRLLVQAAEKEHASSIKTLAATYLTGTLDVTDAEKNGSAALKWILAASKLGDLPSLQRLIPAYRNGEFGLKPDAAEADRLQAIVNKALGIDPNAKKKRRPR